ncbi:MAG: hypothetical protein AB7S38_27615 [Vulcanimicrobiota bacterium]
MDLTQWRDQLTPCLTGVLAELPVSPDEIAMLVLDLHPWEGHLELCLLTRDEARQDPALRSVEESAAWQHFAFSEELVSWAPTAALAARMRADYEQAGQKAVVGRAYFEACAEAMAQAYAGLKFPILLSHPDDGEVFFRSP